MNNNKTESEAMAAAEQLKGKPLTQNEKMLVWQMWNDSDFEMYLRNNQVAFKKIDHEKERI